MSPERWRRIEELYHSALDREAGDRAAFLAQLDPESLQEVESLLAQKSGEGILASPAWDAATSVLESTVAHLAAGAQIGPYKIEGPLGAGGMGEVFRARDTRLGRAVAIKVTDQRFSARFEREARAISALNHPHICTLHDIGPNYLVMELVEGETLDARLRRGKLSLDETLRYGAQIADAIAAAHAKGIVHRDLKPGNIMLTKSGVKVLDFGLAKSPQDQTITVTRMVMGTPAYMAPEQLEGKVCDARTDIYALGLVLYEMVSGKRSVQGQIPALDTLPPQLRHVIEPCLAQDPEDRWQAAKDIRKELEWTSKVQLAAPAGSSRNPQSPWTWGAAGLVVVALAIAWWMVHTRGASELPRTPMVSTAVLAPDGAEFDFNFPWALPALSPDGNHLVFGASSNGKTQLWLRRLDSPTAQPLAGTESASFPFWSPDSRWVAFGQGNKLKKIDIQGGPPVTITDTTAEILGGSWNGAGIIVFGVDDTSTVLMRVPAVGGIPVRTTTVEEGKESRPHMQPWFLPDGTHFLYTSLLPGKAPLRVGSLDEPGKPGKVIAQADSNAIYAQGHLLYMRGNTLLAQAFDLGRLETAGVPIRLAEGIPSFPGSRQSAFAVSTGGSLVYESIGATTRSQFKWKDRQGNELGTLQTLQGVVGSIALSPDGKRLAVEVQDRPGSGDIWIYDSTRLTSARFTFDPAWDSDPVWAPDGNFLYFRSNRRGPFDLFRKSSNGAGSEELVLEDSADKVPGNLSPDGKLLLYTRLGESNQQRSLGAALAPRSLQWNAGCACVPAVPDPRSPGNVLARRPVGWLHCQRSGAGGSVRNPIPRPRQQTPDFFWRREAALAS